jgi:DNA mismatch repair protein MutS
MGGRLIRQWVKQPLLCSAKIAKRQDGIEELLRAPSELKEKLKGVRDLERLIMKVSSGYASPKDLVALRFSLEQIPAVHALLSVCQAEILQQAVSLLHDPSAIASLIASALVDEPPLKVSDGNLFRKGFNSELDELTTICYNSKEWLAQYQAHLRESTGIKTLRVGFTRVFGYYIEVSKAQAVNMPDSFARRQTLANTERFISPELKDYETKVLSAEDKISALESR